MAKDIKRRAKAAGRDVRCVAALILLLADTQSEADQLAQNILDNADRQALDKWMEGTQMDSESFDAHTLDMFCIGGGSLPIIGTKETIAQAIIDLYHLGMDGVLLSFVDYLDGTKKFGREVSPILREAGVL